MSVLNQELECVYWPDLKKVIAELKLPMTGVESVQLPNGCLDSERILEVASDAPPFREDRAALGGLQTAIQAFNAWILKRAPSRTLTEWRNRVFKAIPEPEKLLMWQRASIDEVKDHITSTCADLKRAAESGACLRPKTGEKSPIWTSAGYNCAVKCQCTPQDRVADAFQVPQKDKFKRGLTMSGACGSGKGQVGNQQVVFFPFKAANEALGSAGDCLTTKDTTLVICPGSDALEEFEREGLIGERKVHTPQGMSTLLRSGLHNLLGIPIYLLVELNYHVVSLETHDIISHTNLNAWVTLSTPQRLNKQLGNLIKRGVDLTDFEEQYGLIIWDEGDYGSSVNQDLSIRSAYSWDIAQLTFKRAFVMYMTGTDSDWMADLEIPEVSKCSYGELLELGRAKHLRVKTLDHTGIKVNGHEFGPVGTMSELEKDIVTDNPTFVREYSHYMISHVEKMRNEHGMVEKGIVFVNSGTAEGHRETYEVVKQVADGWKELPITKRAPVVVMLSKDDSQKTKKAIFRKLKNHMIDILVVNNICARAFSHSLLTVGLNFRTFDDTRCGIAGYWQRIMRLCRAIKADEEESAANYYLCASLYGCQGCRSRATMDDKDWYSKATTSRPRHEACFQEVTAEWQKLDWAHKVFRYENPGTLANPTPKAELVQKKQQCTLLEPALNTDTNKAVLLHKLSEEGARRHFNAAELFQVEEEFVPRNESVPEPSMPHNEGEVGEVGNDTEVEDDDDSASDISDKEESAAGKKAAKPGPEEANFFKDNQQHNDGEPDPAAIEDLIARTAEEQKRLEEERKKDPAYLAMLAAKDAKRLAANEKARVKRAEKKAAKEAAKEEAKQRAQEAREKREAEKAARRAAEDAADAAMDDDVVIGDVEVPEEQAEAFSAAQCTFKAVKGGRVEITVPYVVPNATHMLVVSEKSDTEPNANESWKEGACIDKTYIKNGSIKMEFNYQIKGKFLQNAKRVAVIYYVGEDPVKNIRTECYIEGEIEDIICQSCAVPRHVDLLAAWESFEKLPTKRARSPAPNEESEGEEDASDDDNMPVDEGVKKNSKKPAAKKPRNRSKYAEVDSDYDDEGDSEDDDFEEDGGEDGGSSDSDSDVDSKSSKKPRGNKDKSKRFVLTHATIKRVERAVRKGNKNAVYLPFFFTLMVEAPHPDEAAAEHLVDAHAWTAPHYAAHWYAVLQKYVAHRADVTNGFRARMEALHAKSLRDIGIEVEAVLGAYPEGFADLVGFLALVKKPAMIAAVPASGSEASAQETHLAEGEQMDVEVEPESGWIKITDQSGKTRCPKRERVASQRAVAKAEKDHKDGMGKRYLGDVLAIVWDDSESIAMRQLCVVLCAAINTTPVLETIGAGVYPAADASKHSEKFSIFKSKRDQKFHHDQVTKLFTSEGTPFTKIDMLPGCAKDYVAGIQEWGKSSDVLWAASWPTDATWHTMGQYIHSLKWAARCLALQEGKLFAGQEMDLMAKDLNLEKRAEAMKDRARLDMWQQAGEEGELTEDSWKAFMVKEHPELHSEIYPRAGEGEGV